jgi:hypothetical protein
MQQYAQMPLAVMLSTALMPTDNWCSRRCSTSSASADA